MDRLKKLIIEMMAHSVLDEPMLFSGNDVNPDGVWNIGKELLWRFFKQDVGDIKEEVIEKAIELNKGYYLEKDDQIDFAKEHYF